ncbi:EF-P lysine aminoacylase EpmA [Thiolinea disciformis]|uniref:EF-P lysine aminoacylase EpmA n=1 Tax=Thiolinea disciformis TaxID=125614 RepID=UPI00038254AF|nr:EF-P lysine aminoacylase EpmA [Thiolinea disciformis]
MPNPSWRPSATFHALKARACLNEQIRAFFAERGVLEVETPALSQAGTTDPALASFSVVLPEGRRYLHTSPEYPMKRLLANGSGDIYQLCKVWRDDEYGRRHNPEFTMLEYYRVGFTYQRLMQEVAQLLQLLIPHLQPEPDILTYRESFLHYLAIDPYTASDTALAACAKQQGLEVQSDLSRQAWYDLLFTHCIEPNFAPDRLSFIYHYPAEQAALARVKQEQGYWVAERFEVYCGAMELGNGYQEQQNPVANRHTLIHGNQQRKTAVTVDERFLSALELGKLPFCAGVAIGVDRVLLCRLREKHLQHIISFAWELA